MQDAFNTTSMSLDFDVVKPLVLMSGAISGELSTAVEVRPISDEDYAGCDELCRKIYGFSRVEELRGTARMMPAFVAVRENKIVAYAAAPNRWQMNHAVAESNEDMEDLLSGAAKLTRQPLSFLLPTRNGDLFRRCLRQKLKVFKPMTLINMGEYQEPRADFLPSVLY